MCNGVSVRVVKDPAAAKKTTSQPPDQDDDNNLAPDGLPKKIKGSGMRGPKIPSPAITQGNPLRTPSSRGKGIQVPGIG